MILEKSPYIRYQSASGSCWDVSEGGQRAKVTRFACHGAGGNQYWKYESVSECIALYYSSMEGTGSRVRQSGQALSFVDFSFRSSAVFPRCCASSATLAAAQAELGRRWK